jgi:hypothetical protein
MKSRSGHAATRTTPPLLRWGMLVITVLVLGGSLGCAHRYAVRVDGPAGMGPDAELAIQEMLVRNLVADEPVRRPVMVSLGGWPAESADPPGGFLERLSDVPVSLKPVSQFDQASTPNAVLIALHEIQWTTEDEASVVVTRVRFGVGASDGFTANVQRTDGAWRITGTTHHWNT